MKNKIGSLKEWNPLKWTYVISWILTGVLLIIDIIFLVLWSNSKIISQTDAISSVSFILICVLSIAIFSQVIDIYKKKKR